MTVRIERPVAVAGQKRCPGKFCLVDLAVDGNDLDRGARLVVGCMRTSMK